MAEAIPFTDNYTDLSNGDGYQFEFRCERCGNGYRSAYQRDNLSLGQGLLRSASNVLGGRLSNIGYAAGDMLDRRTNSAAKDRALTKAVQEISRQFTQCRGCADWVCHDICWNEQAGQCVRCSPRFQDELGGLQAEARRNQAREHLATADLLGDTDLRSSAVASCPACGARTSGGKFCPDCGTDLRAARKCTSCQAENPASAKFCAECGTSVSN